MNTQIMKNKPQVTIIEAKTSRSHQKNLQNQNNIAQKKVCAYCRVSTDQYDQQSSYDLQVNHYTNYIQNNSQWEFIGIYADEGVSGTSTRNRNEFQRMIQDCEDGKIDMIITKSISRFARNTLDCLNYVRKLKNLEKPVGIFFEKENLDTLDARSELLLTILSSLAQDESRSTSENIKWAIQKKFQAGIPRCPTVYFLGYDTDENGKLVINEEQAITIRRIFQEYLAGSGTNIIAQGLTRDGVLTGRGKVSWTPNAVYRILMNEKYCGDILMQKRVTIDFLTHKRVLNNGHQPQYFISNHHPAIIAKDDWNAVQAELVRRRKIISDKSEKPLKYSNCSPFSNRLFCDKCGEPYFRRSFKTTKKGIVYPYAAWRCRTAEGRIENKECDAKALTEIALEHSFMDMLSKMKSQVEKITIEFKTALSNCNYKDEDSFRMEYLQTEIDIIEEKLIEASTLAMNSSASDVYDDLTYELTKQLESYQSEWNNLNSNKYAELQMEKDFNWFIEQLETIPCYDPEKNTVPFRDDIFIRLIEKGEVLDINNDISGGTIIYTFNIGIKGISVGNHINQKTLRKLIEIGNDEK
ncbi:MAG: recombinase family protein [Eubacteriales bacterium]